MWVSNFDMSDMQGLFNWKVDRIVQSTKYSTTRSTGASSLIFFNGAKGAMLSLFRTRR